MTTLALFWPMPGIAALADPRELARSWGRPMPLDEAEARVRRALWERLPAPGSATTGGEAWYWTAALGVDVGLPAELRAARDRVVGAISGAALTDDDARDDPRGIEEHVTVALAAIDGTVPDGSRPSDLHEVVADLALHSPANIAWRSLRRLAGDGQVSEARLWEAAVVIANGLRTLFRRPDSAALLDHIAGGDGVPYWRAVLRYARMGNLQAVLDEYLHHLAPAEGVREIDEKAILRVAKAAASAMSIQPSPYEAFDPSNPTRPIRFNARFALRYGGRRANEDTARAPQIRGAFNSPFWPFVLATTSAGQEGIDFHWWCHAIVHWNTPANPVDFEQREGRVHRYAGHAVRRNIVERHAAAMLRAADADPWRAGYALATDERERFGDFTPHWVYPGSARVQRHLLPLTLSTDVARLARIKRDVALYRLTFGQPRQEDMLELLRGVPTAESLPRIDLRPPPEDSV